MTKAKRPTLTTDAGKRLLAWEDSEGKALQEFGWARLDEAIFDIEQEARAGVEAHMVDSLRALVIRAQMVADWTDNITEWSVPPPLNAELRDLGTALDAFRGSAKGGLER